MDTTTRHAMAALAALAIFSLGCINLFDDDSPEATVVDESGCTTFGGDEPALGYSYHGATPLTANCNVVPVEAGFQGGFHITPIVWVPEARVSTQRTGVMKLTVTFLEHSVDTIEVEREVFEEWWTEEGDGAFLRHEVRLSSNLVEGGGRWPVQIDVVITFDDPSSEGITLTRETVLQR